MASNINQRYKLEGRELVSPTQITKTVAATGTPEAITATPTFCSTMIILGKKAARTANTSSVYLQWGTATNDAGAYEVSAGGETWFRAEEGGKFDLNNIYVDATTNGDGVTVIYW